MAAIGVHTLESVCHPRGAGIKASATLKRKAGAEDPTRNGGVSATASETGRYTGKNGPRA